MAIAQEGDKLQQYLCVLIVSMGAFCVGCCTAWTSPSLKYLMSPEYPVPSLVISVEESNWVAALTPLGAICGSLPAGTFSDMLGRKRLIIVATVIQVSAQLSVTFTKNIVQLYFTRFILGTVIGMYCVVIPMYIVEIAEISIRGTLGTSFELFINCGILYCYVSGISDSYFTICSSITAVAVLFLICLAFIPESPIHLLAINREESARKCLKRLRGSKFNVEQELNELHAQLGCSSQQKLSRELIFRKANIKGLVISIMLMIFQQFSGINAVIFFSEIIFRKAEVSSPDLCTIVLGATQIVGPVICAVLVDRVGRKILLIVSSVAMIVCHAGMSYYFWLQERKLDTSEITWLPLLSLASYMLVYSIGFGPIGWMMFAELLGPEIKKFGFGICAAVNLFSVSLITFSFQPLSQLITTAGTFLLYASCCLMAAVFVKLIVPETKNKSLKQIQDKLAGINSVDYHLQCITSYI